MHPDLEFPRRRPRQTPVTADADRYSQLAESLRDPATPTWIKAATVLLLICAQPVTRIAAIPLDAITTNSVNDLDVHLGKDAVSIPAAIANPIIELTQRRPHMNTAANQTSPWLFPGKTPGRHVDPQTMMKLLRSNGINLRGARNGAMRELLRSIPPAILAHHFGFHPGTTERHALATGTAWSSYPTLHEKTKP